MAVPLLGLAAISGGSSLLSGLLGGRARSRASKRMVGFWNDQINRYYQSPAYQKSMKYALGLLEGGDPYGVMGTAYQRNLSNITTSAEDMKRKNQMILARGGLLSSRPGLLFDLNRLVEEGKFGATERAGADYATQRAEGQRFGAGFAQKLQTAPFGLIYGAGSSMRSAIPYAGSEYNVASDFFGNLGNYFLMDYTRQDMLDKLAEIYKGGS